MMRFKKCLLKKEGTPSLHQLMPSVNQEYPLIINLLSYTIRPTMRQARSMSSTELMYLIILPISRL